MYNINIQTQRLQEDEKIIKKQRKRNLLINNY